MANSKRTWKASLDKISRFMFGGGGTDNNLQNF